jgi:hypothetical protein
MYIFYYSGSRLRLISFLGSVSFRFSAPSHFVSRLRLISRCSIRLASPCLIWLGSNTHIKQGELGRKEAIAEWRPREKGERGAKGGHSRVETERERRTRRERRP